MKYGRILTGVLLASFAVLAGFLLYDRRQATIQYSTASRSVESAGAYADTTNASNTPDADGKRSHTLAGFKPDAPPSGNRKATYRFTFAGNRSFSATVLVSALRLRPETHEEAILAQGIRRDLRDFYLSHGYVHFAVVELDIDLGIPTRVFCEISEGPQFTFGSISAQTSDREIAWAFEEAASVGSPANLTLMRRLTRQLTEQYRADGYFDFKTSVDFEMAAETLDFTVKADTGQRYLIGQVSIPAGIPELEPLEGLIRQPYSRSVIEFYLDKAGLPWEAVQLHKDSWDAVVDIEINPRIEESGR